MKRLNIVAVIAMLTLIRAAALSAAELTGAYDWKPINIGAGGYANGIIISPTDPNVRYARTDTGQFYRWDVTASRWLPMVGQRDDGSGFGTNLFPMPNHGIMGKGNEGSSFALDPTNNNTVYLYGCIGDQGINTYPFNVYKSIDGGRNFNATHLNDVTQFTYKTNDTFVSCTSPLDFYPIRQDGECLKVDPNNSAVVYLGTGTKGLFKSVDAGNTWSAWNGQGLPAPTGTIYIINTLPYKNGGTVVVNGVTVSKIIYLVYNKNAVYPAHIYGSNDGGQTWADLNGPTGGHSGVLDQNNEVLYVTAATTNRPQGTVCKYETNTWTVDMTTQWAQIGLVTVDPHNSSNLFAMGSGPIISTNAGKTWSDWVWQPHLPCTNAQGFSGSRHTGAGNSTATVLMDQTGTVWWIGGNDGLLNWKFDPTATNSNMIVWTPNTAGVENFCSMDICFPKNTGDKAIVTVMDEEALVVNNLDTFDVSPKPETGLNNGQCISVCPNDSSMFALVSYSSAITTNGGQTYVVLTNAANGPALTDCSKLPPYTFPSNIIYGCLEVSRRGNWSAGADHLVRHSGRTDTAKGPPAVYSKDGGRSWAYSTTDFGTDGFYISPWSVNHNVVADPFVPDKFYAALGGFWTTTNGGVTWTRGTAIGISGELRANDAVPNDLWLGNGNGAHGLLHSTDAGVTWTEVLGNGYLQLLYGSVALGKGRGQPGDAPYTVYTVYHDNPYLTTPTPAKDYGIYRSIDAGVSWSHVSKLPTGLNPGLLSASWDTYGLIGTSIGGQGFVYGKPKATTITELVATPNNTPVGAPVQFTVAPAGTSTNPLSITWQFGDGNGSSGSTGMVTHIYAAARVYTASVVVAADAQSATGSVVVNVYAGSFAPPVFTLQPTNMTVIKASITDAVTAVFSALASGTPAPGYLWIMNGTPITYLTSASMSLAGTAGALDGAQFQLVATNAAGRTCSAIGTVTILYLPTFDTQPADASVNVGSSAGFSVSVSGTAPLFYQWQTNSVNISDATNAVYVIASTTSADSGKVFRVVVTNFYGCATSATARLTVNPSGTPGFAIQPTNLVVSLGDSATFLAQAFGALPLIYQWKRGANVVSVTTNLSYATSSYTVMNTTTNDDGAVFNVVVTNAAGSTSSSSATLTVSSMPQITAQPTNAAVTAGQSAMFTVTAIGSAPLLYQWQKGAVNIDGATASSYTTPGTTLGDNGSQYRVVVSNADAAVTSSVATVTVLAAPAAPLITTQPASMLVTVGHAATFTVVATGTASLFYQWRTNGTNGTAISLATNQSYTIPTTTLNDSGKLFCVVVSNMAGSVTSSNATLTVSTSRTDLNSAPYAESFDNLAPWGGTYTNINIANGWYSTASDKSVLCKLPYAFSNCDLPLGCATHTNVLQLNTQDATLTNSFGSGYDMSSGITYWDMMVQFTPNVLSVAALSTTGSSNDDSGLKTACIADANTNLMVYCSVRNPANGSLKSNVLVNTGVRLNTQKWFRLTVIFDATFSDTNNPGNFQVFKVALNGIPITNTAGYAYDDNWKTYELAHHAYPTLTSTSLGCWFPSATTGQAATRLTSISFQGTGCIDDLIFTNGAPTYGVIQGGLTIVGGSTNNIGGGGTQTMARVPFFQSINLEAGGPYGMTFLADPGVCYDVLWRTNLLTGDWLSFTNMIGAGENANVYFTNAEPQAFFLIRAQQ